LNTIEKRIFGLDLLRSIAIILVVLMHSSSLLTFSIPGYGYFTTVDGVDLFFVLSGFLVGSILIDIIIKKQGLTFHDVKVFLKKRWLRTLPNYFLFLLINIILIYFGLVKGELNKYLSTYFVFFQNFYKPFDFLFWESWSLAVEEWFYLLFPLIILSVFLVARKPRTAVITSIILFLVSPLLYRVIHSGMNVDGVHWDLYFRKLVLTRIDSIGYGILGAYIYKFHLNFWNRSKNYFLIAGLLILIFLTLDPIEHNLFYYKTFYFSMIGIGILFLIPKLESLKTERIPLKPFAFISRISYSMYLCHIPLYQIISANMDHSVRIISLLVFLFYWLAVIVVSAIIYRFFEKPFMDLRKRIS
jgi:peptidoglycan/LPS O-acetylase OafA/YrhL